MMMGAGKNTIFNYRGGDFIMLLVRNIHLYIWILAAFSVYKVWETRIGLYVTFQTKHHFHPLVSLHTMIVASSWANWLLCKL